MTKKLLPATITGRAREELARWRRIAQETHPEPQ